jgi:septum site-determining protein MinC
MGKFVQVKGNSKGFAIQIFEPEFEEICEEVTQMMRESKGFFKGAKFAGFQGRNLREDEEARLLEIVESDFDLKAMQEEAREDQLNEGHEKSTADLEPERVPLHVIARTLRSGQRIDVEGDLVLMGDANPGSILTATGNIVVVGALRGTAHAGINGDDGVSVSAYRLQPLQLRIADVIARSPDREEQDGKREIARLNEQHEISISTI